MGKELRADRASCDYARYFLTVHDIVALCARDARSDSLPGPRLGGQFGGVLRACGITAVDPDDAPTLLFERFLSEERKEPPDIDVDFEHERREEVIQHIYKKYTAAIAPRIVATLIHLPAEERRSAMSARRWACRRT